MFKIDSKVKLTLSLFGQAEGKECAATGKVVGFGHKREIPMILVELDQGFYNPEHTIFVSILMVHSDNISPIS